MNNITKFFRTWAQAFALIIVLLTAAKLIEGASQLKLGVILEIGSGAALFLLIDMLVMARVSIRSTAGYIIAELAILLPCYLAAGWVLNWYDKSVAGFAVFLIAFFAIYTLTFSVQRQQLKLDAKRINELLKKHMEQE